MVADEIGEGPEEHAFGGQLFVELRGNTMAVDMGNDARERGPVLEQRLKLCGRRGHVAEGKLLRLESAQVDALPLLHRLQWECRSGDPPGGAWHPPEGSTIPRKTKPGGWVALNQWALVGSSVDPGSGPDPLRVHPDPWQAVPHLHPRLRSDERVSAGESALFLTFNRNKQSVVLDLKRPEGLEVFYDLARRSDVVLDNFRPGVLERLKIDYETDRKSTRLNSSHRT